MSYGLVGEAVRVVAVLSPMQQDLSIALERLDRRGFRLLSQGTLGTGSGTNTKIVTR